MRIIFQFFLFMLSTTQSDHSASNLKEEEFKLSEAHAEEELSRIVKAEKNISQNIAFWNSVADGKLESTVAVCNLFILLIALTLASSKYKDGPTQETLSILGWISCTLVVSCYLIGFLIKVSYVPYLQRLLKQNSSQGFTIFERVLKGEVKLENLEFKNLLLVGDILENRPGDVRRCFPKVNTIEVLEHFKFIVGVKFENLKSDLEELKAKESKAKFAQSFWQVYALGKTFSIPGTLMLLFIITPFTLATKIQSIQLNNLQGWLAVGFLVIPLLCLPLIKYCLWDYLNFQVKQARVQPFQIFSNVYINHIELRTLTLAQLEDLNTTIEERGDEFQKCFSEVDLKDIKDEINTILKVKLPKKTSENEEIKINEVVQRANKLKDTHSTWLNFFSTKIVGFIITVYKFQIVMAVTFVENYPDTHEGLRQAQRILGGVAIAWFVFGYLCYTVIANCWLGYLKRRAEEERSSPFTTFRLIYFGNKQYSDLEVHELQDIIEGVEQRKEQFAESFPKVHVDGIFKQIRDAIQLKRDACKSHNLIYPLFQEESSARKRLEFWNLLVDGHLLYIGYSSYLVLIMVISTFTVGDTESAAIFGWIGLGLLPLIISVLTIFKCYILPYLKNDIGVTRIEGYSDFNSVHLKEKQLKDLELHTLERILEEMDLNPVEFKKCFPSINFKKTQEDIIYALNVKKHESHFYDLRDKMNYQKQLLNLTRTKDMLAVWSKLIKEKLFPIMPICLILELLWFQTIAIDRYGFKVCAFLAVGMMSLAGLLVIFFKLYLEGSLEQDIKEIQIKLRQLQTKRH